MDPEKYSYDRDDDESGHSDISSQPFLRQRHSRTHAHRYSHRSSRHRAYSANLMRWICLSIFAGLLLFIFALFRVTLTQAIFKTTAHPNPSVLKPQPPEWESFPFLQRFYGGIRTLVPQNESTPEFPAAEKSEGGQAEKEERFEVDPDRVVKSVPFDPYPDYRSSAYVEKYGKKVDCFLDGDRKIAIPGVRRHEGLPRGFPEPAMGSNELIGLDAGVCYDRFGRLGPYGLGYGVRSGGTGAGLHGDRAGVEYMWEHASPVHYRNVNWAQAQEQCRRDNAHRFLPPVPPKDHSFMKAARDIGVEESTAHINKKVEDEKTEHINESDDINVTNDEKKAAHSDTNNEDDNSNTKTAGKEKLGRTAFLIRTWSDYHYDTETILYLRSLVAELALFSGGEYEVRFLIHVKDDNIPIWSDEETHARILRESLPAEFHGLGTLWSERQMGLIYGGLEESFARGLPVHGVYRSSFMPVQYFAHQHPEYAFFWNWEMDARFTGHWYDLFNRMGVWAREQPRKGLWERNGRFYVPRVHGSWEDFRHTVRVQTEQGTLSPNNMFSPLSSARPNGHRPMERKGDKPIWGPERPSAPEDVLTQPSDCVPPTSYEKDKMTWGVGEEADLLVLNPLYDPEGTTWLLKDDVTGYNKSHAPPPRRAAIIAASRLSRNLLQTMHVETSLKRHHMFSEMWPPSVALHHGYKAVYVPHAVYIDRQWPLAYLEAVFNAGRNGATGGARTSVFGAREHNFRGTTWFYSAGHAENLYRRWMGYRSNGDGGEEWELASEGRMCLPPMLLHPIKGVSMVIDDGGRN